MPRSKLRRHVAGVVAACQLVCRTGTNPHRAGSTCVALEKGITTPSLPWTAKSANPLKMQEQLMKLNSMQVKQTLNQMEAHVLPDDHPAVLQFTDIFGDHTFFLDQSGLKVLEPTEAPLFGMQSGEVVSLADWTDATLTSLRPHEPELTGTIITFPKVSH
jgi:hypothetical protein